MSNYVLDKAYRITAANGVPAGRVVVRGANAEECTLPAGAGAANVLGIATHSQPRAGRHVAVRRLGIAAAVAAGPIALGSRVRVADNQGRVAQVPNAVYTTGNGTTALTYEWLDRASFAASHLVELHAPGDESDFTWSITGSGLRLTLASNGAGNVIQTVASLILAVAADPVLSRLIRITKGTGASDSAVLAAATASANNIVSLLNPIGIAEGTATTEGDVIDVLLIP